MLNFDLQINLRFAVIGQLVAYTPDAVTAQNLISGLQTAIRLSELVHAKYCLHYWCVAKLLNANICVSVADPLLSYEHAAGVAHRVSRELYTALSMLSKQVSRI